MVLDAMRNYVQLASGLTDVTRQRAMAAASGLLASSGVDQVVPGALGQVTALADEIVASSKANRELLVGLVRAEVDRAVGGLGLATQDDLAGLHRAVDRLTERLRLLESGGEPPPPGAATASPPATKPAKKPAKKPARKSTKKAPTGESS
ncbi:MAG: polyhydroxyalkanoate synthesis protein PhaF [Actinomycetota bacterium]|nr:polyhydroxyalkanoate synthesis protein PhaF [Actinomycetota bacterium]MDH5277417.1 polyhydroxyalkanoate synthesis protein PhaF [Actinomycetota bacterium]